MLTGFLVIMYVLAQYGVFFDEFGFFPLLAKAELLLVVYFE